MSEIEHDGYSFTKGKEPHIKFKAGYQALRVSVIDGVTVLVIGSDVEEKKRLQWFFHYKENWYSDFLLTDQTSIDSSIELQLQQADKTLQALKHKA